MAKVKMRSVEHIPVVPALVGDRTPDCPAGYRTIPDTGLSGVRYPAYFQEPDMSGVRCPAYFREPDMSGVRYPAMIWRPDMSGVRCPAVM